MRILMISYPFPPWGGNTKRALYQANYLARRGHEVHVLAAHPCHRLPGQDASLVGAIDARVTVHRVFAGVLHHFRHWLRGHCPARLGEGWLQDTFLGRVLFPLSTAEWLPYGLGWIIAVSRSLRFDIVYSHGDPYVGNLVGCCARLLLGLPWVMYIADPRYFAPGARNRHLLYLAEKLCVSCADHIVVNCRETMEGYLRHFPRLPESRFTVLTDGFDEDLYRGSPARQEGFWIGFTGRLYEGHREPEAFFDALTELAQDAPELRVCGPAAEGFARLAKARGLERLVRSFGNQPFERVVELQSRATVLLAFGRQRGYQVPGKLFEYFGARRPVLAVHEDAGDVAAKYVTRYRRGVAVTSDSGRIAAALRSLIDLWKEGRLDQQFDLRQLPEFTLSDISARFEDVLTGVA